MGWGRAGGGRAGRPRNIAREPRGSLNLNYLSVGGVMVPVRKPVLVHSVLHDFVDMLVSMFESR